ncbi:MAG: phosphatase PAP2 family protein [Myxococcota bacterium]
MANTQVATRPERGLSAAAERALLTGGLVAAFFAAYFAIGWSTDPATGRSLASAVDARIPFVPDTVFLYGGVYTGVLLPLFLIRCPELFRRVAAAYALLIAISMVCFALFPVSAIGLRADLGALDSSRFATWGLRLVYALDPPVNLFPSVHVAVATLAACACWKARRSFGALACVWAVLIAISACTTKQHFAVDALAGVGLGAGVHRVLVHPYRKNDPRPPHYSGRGLLLFAAFHASFMTAMYAAFRAGVGPA